MNGNGSSIGWQKLNYIIGVFAGYLDCLNGKGNREQTYEGKKRKNLHLLMNIGVTTDSLMIH